MLKNLAFVIKFYHDFIRTNDESIPACDSLKLNSLFESVSDSMIPLLQMFERLSEKHVSFN